MTERTFHKSQCVLKRIIVPLHEAHWLAHLEVLPDEYNDAEVCVEGVADEEGTEDSPPGDALDGGVSPRPELGLEDQEDRKDKEAGGERPQFKHGQAKPGQELL